MKKMSWILVFVILLPLCACGAAPSATEPLYTVSEDSFSCSPQEFIDNLNTAIVAADDDLIYEVGAYPRSNEELKIAGTSLTLTLKDNDSNSLRDIHLYWYSGRNNANVLTSAGFYCGHIVTAFAPNEADDIMESISDVLNSGSGSVTRKANGIVFQFEKTETGANRFRVCPERN